MSKPSGTKEYGFAFIHFIDTDPKMFSTKIVESWKKATV